MLNFQNMSQKEEIAFGLFENGLDFILSSTNHFSKCQSKVDIKYGILHLSSGIELVLKYRLSKEHWSLLFQDIDKSSLDSFKSGDFKSVDFESCISRLKKICSLEIQEEECKNLKFLKKKRNKFEHFGITDSEIALKSYSTKVLSFIIDFIDKNIPKEDINDSEYEILDEIRQNLAKFNEFVKHRLDEIQPIINSLKYANRVICPICFQETLEIDNGAKCYFCNYYGSANDVAEDYINNVLGISEYECVKNGGEYPKYICPDCGSNTFICLDADDGLNSWVCFDCGTCYNDDEIDFCSLCNKLFISTDDSGDICNECFEYKVNEE